MNIVLNRTFQKIFNNVTRMAEHQIPLDLQYHHCLLHLYQNLKRETTTNLNGVFLTRNIVAEPPSFWIEQSFQLLTKGLQLIGKILRHLYVADFPICVGQSRLSPCEHKHLMNSHSSAITEKKETYTNIQSNFSLGPCREKFLIASSVFQNTRPAYMFFLGTYNYKQIL